MPADIARFNGNEVNTGVDVSSNLKKRQGQTLARRSSATPPS
jgi:hypothetical protein